MEYGEHITDIHYFYLFNEPNINVWFGQKNYFLHIYKSKYNNRFYYWLEWGDKHFLFNNEGVDSLHRVIKDIRDIIKFWLQESNKINSLYGDDYISLFD